MSSESLRPSVSPTSPIDESIVRVLRLIDPIAREADCPYFIAGATARDLVLVNIHGLRPGRATRDIDFGIAVESWQQFTRLKERLAASGDFTAHPHALQRMTYLGRDAGFSIPVDLIPFRGVTSSDYTFEWPPSRDVVLNVAGFEEALASAIPVAIEADLIVRVASTPGLALLKLVAWSDRHHTTNKDAADFYRLLGSYGDAGNTDRMYDREMALLEAIGFDTQLAGAELLGRDVGLICSSNARAIIESLLNTELTFERLLDQTVQTSALPETADVVGRLLRAFRQGLLGTDHRTVS
jgi:predicted nucleotidyltransferase